MLSRFVRLALSPLTHILQGIPASSKSSDGVFAAYTNLIAGRNTHHSHTTQLVALVVNGDPHELFLLHKRARTHAHTHCASTYTRKRTRTCARTFTRTGTCVPLRTRTRTREHIHTHKHMNVHGEHLRLLKERQPAASPILETVLWNDNNWCACTLLVKIVHPWRMHARSRQCIHMT